MDSFSTYAATIETFLQLRWRWGWPIHKCKTTGDYNVKLFICKAVLHVAWWWWSPTTAITTDWPKNRIDKGVLQDAHIQLLKKLKNILDRKKFMHIIYPLILHVYCWWFFDLPDKNDVNQNVWRMLLFSL